MSAFDKHYNNHVRLKEVIIYPKMLSVFLNIDNMTTTNSSMLNISIMQFPLHRTTDALQKCTFSNNLKKNSENNH
jgi:hypothetical protein